MAKFNRKISRVRRHTRIRKTLKGTEARPRLSVFRSLTNVYAQIIDDVKGHTLVAMSSLSKEFPAMKSKVNIEAAKTLGKLVAEKAKAKGITLVFLDRNGLLYHGRIKAFADAARENGLEF